MVSVTPSCGCSVGPMSSSNRLTRKEQSLDGGCEGPEKESGSIPYPCLILNHTISPFDTKPYHIHAFSINDRINPSRHVRLTF